MQIIDLVANQDYPLGGANEFLIYFAHFPVDVKLVKDGQIIREFKNEGTGFGTRVIYQLSDDGLAFDNALIASSISQRVKMVVSNGPVSQHFDAAETAFERADSGFGFFTRASSGQVAGQYSSNLLFNPANSDFDVVVDGVNTTVSADTKVRVDRIGSAAGFSALSGEVYRSNRFDQPDDTIVELYTRKNATSIIGGGNTGAHLLELTAANPFEHKLPRPYILPPGYGLVTECQDTEVTVRQNFSYYLKLARS